MDKYSTENNPMDVIVVAGLNNFPVPGHYFVCIFAKLKRVVMMKNSKNTFTFRCSDLLNMIGFTKKGPQPEWYVNHLLKINRINNYISMFNRQNINLASHLEVLDQEQEKETMMKILWTLFTNSQTGVNQRKANACILPIKV